MRTIAVLNQKGGVGKTTTVTNTAAALASMGSRVLTIDLDPQAHLTIHFGLEPQDIEAGSYKVLTHSADVSDEVVESRENLWLLPANIDLVGAETELVSVVGREIILREALDKVADRFDYCLIDCPPSLGLLTLNALAAAQEVLIPLQPHFLALQGVGKLLQTVELVNKRINPELRVEGILLCMFDTRASLPSEVRADIEEFLRNARGTNCAWAEAQILPTFIRRNIKLAEAPSYGKTIFEYEQNCHGAEDYKEVAEFIHKGSRSHAKKQGQIHKPAPIPIREAPRPPQPVAMTQEQAPIRKPEPVPTTQTQVPAKPPEQRPSVPQAANQSVNPAPTPIRSTPRHPSEPRHGGERQSPVESRPAVPENRQPAPLPKPKLTSTYEYRPPSPAAPQSLQPQPKSDTNRIQPVAENRPPSAQGIQSQGHGQQQVVGVNKPAFQGPVKKVTIADSGSQTTLQPQPKSNGTYQYRAPAPGVHTPVPPRNAATQPQPTPPANRANVPQGRTPIQDIPAAPGNSQMPVQPRPQANANGGVRPQSAIPPRPVAAQPPQAPGRPNHQQVSSDGVNRQAPIEIRQVSQNGLQKPQQQATSQTNAQIRAARIIEIMPPSQLTPNIESEKATPAEQPEGT